jgi:nitric-oxide synthase
VVAGVGVTPAVAGLRGLARARRIHIVYAFRTAEEAAYLEELRAAARARTIALTEVETITQGRRSAEAARAIVARLGACEVVVCGPGAFNAELVRALEDVPDAEIRVESFVRTDGQATKGTPGAWRRKNFCPARRGGDPVPLKTDLPSDAQAERFLRQFFVEKGNEDQFSERWREVRAEFDETGTYCATFAELEFAARLAWRNAVRCIGRLYWQGLTLRDRRHLAHPDDMAQALFEHLEYAFNDGNIRPTITVFDPGTPARAGPRIWNPQLVRYAGYRECGRKIVGDPAQLEVTERIMQLGWQGGGGRFDVLPLVIACPGHPPRRYEVPKDLVHEVPIAHPDHPWLARMGLRWYPVPAIADMALDAGGILYRCAPFNGWYMGTEIAARNFTDTNRYDLLPEIAEKMGLDLSSDRTLWRDKAMILLNEAVLLSYDRAGVKMADHHEAAHEFLDFCRAEQRLGREPYGKWMWLVPPISGSATPLFQEPFRNVSIKPSYRYQRPAWKA